MTPWKRFLRTTWAARSWPTDPDPNIDPLTYTLEGTDAAKFRVRDNGQIEVASGTELDFETKTDLHGHGHGRGLLR